MLARIDLRLEQSVKEREPGRNEESFTETRVVLINCADDIVALDEKLSERNHRKKVVSFTCCILTY